MRIGIELNGVLRDTLKKIQQEYEKWFLNETWIELNLTPKETDIERKVLSDLTTLDIKNHLVFKDDDELYNFLYKEHTMEIFGHAGSVEYTSMTDLNDFYLDLRDKHDIVIVSDEIGKSKPASLFFISKFGCLVESVRFYSESTLDNLWNCVDILLTANPSLLLKHPKDKILIKYLTEYNTNIEVDHTITKLKELKSKIEEIC